MTRKVHRSESGHLKVAATYLFRRILVGAICLLVAVCLHAPVALAQHGGGAHAGGFGGGGHFGGGGGHFGGGHSAGGAHANSAPRGSAPPPSAPAPTSGIRTPMFAPRTSIFPPTTPLNTRFNAGFNAGSAGNIRLRPVPRPTPAPVPIVFVPVYYSPFFYGGFNSFWGCDPFWGWGSCYSPFGFGYSGFGYGAFGYGAFGYGGWGSGFGGYSGYGNYGYNGNYGGAYNRWSNYSSAGAAEQDTTPQTYVAPSYPTDTRGRDLVELFFKDGTVFNVTDYWLVDGQLHFLTVGERNEKTVEHVLPFDALDVQTTTDVNTRKGFRFQLRNESLEQYLRNHPEAEPKVDPEKPNNQ